MLYKVNPELTTDPYNKRGEIGEKIKYEDNIVTLAFFDGTVGVYSRDALIRMSPRINRNAADNLIVQIAYEFNERLDLNDRYNIPCDDTSYLELSDLRYPILSPNDFKQMILELRSK